MRALPLLLGLALLASSPDALSAPSKAFPSKKTTFGGSRPVELKVPSTYNRSRPTPLVIVLHGLGSNGTHHTNYFGFAALVQQAGILLAAPDGTTNSSQQRFWNATDFCCDFFASGVDDVAYLTQLVKEISTEYNVDPRRIYFAGHSNGGFMSYRVACEHPELVAAVISLAGAMPADAAKCKPSQPVSVLQVHGAADPTIRYEGGTMLDRKVTQPGAVASLDQWKRHNRCTGQLAPTGQTFDIGTTKRPSPVEVSSVSGCPANGAVELWTIPTGDHMPTLGPEFRTRVWAWMNAHAKR